MPHILKEPEQGSKGIAIFTHKEKKWLDIAARPMQNAISKLREKYVVGMHWGGFADQVETVPYLDFHLSALGTMTLQDGVSTPHIKLGSQNFTPACFVPKPEVYKYWDIINVSRPARLKKLDDFLLTIRKIYDKGHQPKVLLVCPCPPDMSDSTRWYSEIAEDYLKLFSVEERKNITLMLLTGLFFPLSRPQVAHFYQSSRIFTLYSQQEGGPKVLAEALLCGLPVVVRRNLECGGLHHLNEKNSKRFDSLDEAADQFIELLTNYDNYQFDPLSLQQEMSEIYTKPRLKAEMEQLFEKLEVPFHGELKDSNLSRNLPSHLPLLPPNLRLVETNDLNSPLSTLLFIQMLIKDLSISPTDKIVLYGYQIMIQSRARMRQIALNALKKSGLFERVKAWRKNSN